MQSSNNCVFLAGCSGGLGTEVCRKLCENGYKVKGLIQNENDKELCKQCGCTDCCVGDMTDLQVKDYEMMLEGCNMIIDCSGAMSTSSKEIKMVEFEATKRLVEAACNKGINRFISVSALGCDNPEGQLVCNTCKSNKQYAQQQCNSDNCISKCDKLNYTIFRVGDLTDEEGSHKVFLSSKITPTEKLERYCLSRKDLADIIVKSLNCNNCFNSIIEVVNCDMAGAKTIDEAIKNFHKSELPQQATWGSQQQQGITV
ncbi:hypothetical protein ABK040_003872 [Willaertia magna]